METVSSRKRDKGLEELVKDAEGKREQVKAGAPPVHICYFLESKMLNLAIEVVISRLRMPRVYPGVGGLRSDQFTSGDCRINAQIFCNGSPMHASVTTRLHPRSLRATGDLIWEDTLIFPVKYCDLSGDSTLVLTMVDADGTVLGGATMSFFDRESSRLAEGQQYLLVHLGAPGDGGLSSSTASGSSASSENDFMFRLEGVRNSGQLGRTGLDKATRQYLGKALETVMRANQAGTNALSNAALTGGEVERLACCYLEVELARPRVPVVFDEHPYPVVHKNRTREHIGNTFSELSKDDDAQQNLSLHYRASTGRSAMNSGPAAENSYGWGLSFVHDWEVADDPVHPVTGGSGLMNPAQDKYDKMHQHLTRGVPARDLLPNITQRAEIDAIIRAPLDDMTRHQKNLIWYFQESLTNNPAAVVKFVLSVNWENEQEKQYAQETLKKWDKTGDLIDIANGLKLLSNDFPDPFVREFAVNRLSKATDSELNAYLLQLVAALRYEPKIRTDWDANARNPSAHFVAYERSPLAQLLIDRACKAEHPYTLANFLYWYLKVEIDAVKVRRENKSNDNPPLPGDLENGQMFEGVLRALMDTLAGTAPEVSKALTHQSETFKRISDAQLQAKNEKGNRDVKLHALIKKLKKFGEFKIEGFGKHPVSSPLNPQVQLVKLRDEETKMFKSALYPAMIVFERIPESNTRDKVASVEQRTSEVEEDSVRKKGGAADDRDGDDDDDDDDDEEEDEWAAMKMKKEAALRRRLGTIDKSDSVNVLDAFKAHQKKERDALDKQRRTYKIMLKNGDDVRQDQLIMQLIRIMDDKLKMINMDLELVPYGILSTEAESGLLEFVSAADGSRSWTMSEVLAKFNNSVIDFLQKYNPDNSTNNRVSAQCMNTFVKSCAGYAVVTFLLGIGDRHLDNVMMLQDGHFLHIDFGWIFGEDPKKNIIKPPPFRFHKSLLEAMGGKTGDYYQKFCNQAKAAYLHLRQHAPLLLNLCRLMVDAGIEAFVLVGQRGGHPDDLLKVMLERFRLTETDEVAGIYFDEIIAESVNHTGVEVLERFHKIAVSLR